MRNADQLLAAAKEKARELILDTFHSHVCEHNPDEIARALLEAQAEALEDMACLMLVSGDSQRLRECSALIREAAKRVT